MIKQDALQQCWSEIGVSETWQAVPEIIRQRLELDAHGDMRRWRQALAELPALDVSAVHLNRAAVSLEASMPLSGQQREQMITALQMLHPWRKGPFDLFGVDIDTEWRSDWKWDRVLPHIDSLQDKIVLDIGCGSGYHVWRMLGAGARYVIGVEPSLLFNMQFHALNRYIQSERAFVLPLTAEQLPSSEAFDTVFSMGVLYHRPSPIEHLNQLLAQLKPGGQLVVETLVLKQHGRQQAVLCPEQRYAQMRNVWFIPNSELMLTWMRRCGIVEPRLVDESKTSCEEQRQTEWMRFHSLQHYLDAENPELTVEGYPAPLRATFVGYKKQ